MSSSPELLACLLPIVKTLRRMEEDAAATEDIRMWQYAILSVVLAEPGSNQGTVAARMDYSPNRIIADIDDLESKGLITRTRGADRRVNELRVTAAGRRVHGRVRRAIRSGEDAALAGLADSRQQALRATLARLAADLRA